MEIRSNLQSLKNINDLIKKDIPIENIFTGNTFESFSGDIEIKMFL